MYVEATLIRTHYRSAAGCGFTLKVKGGGRGCVCVCVVLYIGKLIAKPPEHGFPSPAKWKLDRC